MNNEPTTNSFLPHSQIYPQIPHTHEDQRFQNQQQNQKQHENDQRSQNQNQLEENHEYPAQYNANPNANRFTSHPSNVSAASPHIQPHFHLPTNTNTDVQNTRLSLGFSGFQDTSVNIANAFSQAVLEGVRPASGPEILEADSTEGETQTQTLLSTRTLGLEFELELKRTKNALLKRGREDDHENDYRRKDKTSEKKDEEEQRDAGEERKRKSPKIRRKSGKMAPASTTRSRRAGTAASDALSEGKESQYTNGGAQKYTAMATRTSPRKAMRERQAQAQEREEEDDEEHDRSERALSPAQRLSEAFEAKSPAKFFLRSPGGVSANGNASGSGSGTRHLSPPLPLGNGRLPGSSNYHQSFSALLGSDNNRDNNHDNSYERSNSLSLQDETYARENSFVNARLGGVRGRADASTSNGATPADRRKPSVTRKTGTSGSSRTNDNGAFDPNSGLLSSDLSSADEGREGGVAGRKENRTNAGKMPVKLDGYLHTGELSFDPSKRGSRRRSGGAGGATGGRGGVGKKNADGVKEYEGSEYGYGDGDDYEDEEEDAQTERGGNASMEEEVDESFNDVYGTLKTTQRPKKAVSRTSGARQPTQQRGTHLQASGSGNDNAQSNGPFRPPPNQLPQLNEWESKAATRSPFVVVTDALSRMVHTISNGITHMIPNEATRWNLFYGFVVLAALGWMWHLKGEEMSRTRPTTSSKNMLDVSEGDAFPSPSAQYNAHGWSRPHVPSIVDSDAVEVLTRRLESIERTLEKASSAEENQRIRFSGDLDHLKNDLSYDIKNNGERIESDLHGMKNAIQVLRVEIDAIQKGVKSLGSDLHQHETDTKREFGYVAHRITAVESDLKKALSEDRFVDLLVKALPKFVPVRNKGNKGHLEVDPAFWAEMKKVLGPPRTPEDKSEVKIRTPSLRDFLQENEYDLRVWAEEIFDRRVSAADLVPKDEFENILRRELEGLKTEQDILRRKELENELAKIKAGKETGQILKQSNDITASLNSLIDRALLKYSKDVIAKADFALASAGARVVGSQTTPTMLLEKPRLFANIVYGARKVEGRGPLIALHTDNNPAMCWPFEGSQGQLGIALSRKIKVTDVTMEHIARELMPEVDSAPREVEVVSRTTIVKWFYFPGFFPWWC